MNKYNSIDIGKRIAKIRTEKGFTQEVLAKKTGLNDKSISAIESRHRNLRTTTLLNICNALDVTTDYLLTGRIPQTFIHLQFYLSFYKWCKSSYR